MSNETQLTLPERAAVALGAPRYEQEIRELVAKTVTITEVKNKDGREQCHGAMMTLKNARVAIEKAAKAAREDATAFSKAVIAEEKRLVALAEPEEARLQALRDAWDAEIEREKKAKAAAEKARVDGIRKMIDEIKAVPTESVGRSSADLTATVELMEMHEITLEQFAEFAGEVEMAKIAALAKLRGMRAAQQAHEAEQDRLAAERAELERLRAEAAERERVSAEARAEAERQASAAREREEAERRKRDVQERAERQRIDGIRERISQIKATVAMQAGKPSASIESAISALQSMDMSGFDEFHQEAGLAYGSTLDQLRDMFTSMQALEAQQAELARQQAEIDRQRAEQERRDREARELLEAQEREAEVEEAHQEALWEEARINAERHEAQRKAGEAKAAELDRLRRQQAEFEANGPEDWEIVQVIAAHYDVTPEVAKHWLGRHAWMEKAA